MQFVGCVKLTLVVFFSVPSQINLIGNALKFSRSEVKRGQVVVYARVLYVEPYPAPDLVVPAVPWSKKLRSKKSATQNSQSTSPNVSRKDITGTLPTSSGIEMTATPASTAPSTPSLQNSSLIATGVPLPAPVFQPFSPPRNALLSPAIPESPVGAEETGNPTAASAGSHPSSPDAAARSSALVKKDKRGSDHAFIHEHALRALAPGEFLIEFEVEDCGCGIPADKIDRLFKAFSQVDSSVSRTHGGTGLGLSISLGLTKLMGGKLRVTSVVKKGSSFFFTIITRDGTADSKLAPDASQQQTFLSPGPVLSGPSGSPTLPTRQFLGARQLVILVHENLAFHASMSAQFSKWNLSFLCTASPDQALAWVQGTDRPAVDEDGMAPHFPPAAILVDAFFPSTQGRMINAALFAMELQRFWSSTNLQQVPLLLLRPSNLVPVDPNSTPRGSGSGRHLLNRVRTPVAANLAHLDDASIEQLFVRSLRKPLMYTSLYRVLWSTLRAETPTSSNRALTDGPVPAARLPLHRIRSIEEGEEKSAEDEEHKSPEAAAAQSASTAASRVPAPILLPVPASASPADLWAPVAKGTLLPMRVILADDDSTNRKLLKRFLLKLGYDNSTLSVAQNIEQCSERGISIAASSIGNEDGAMKKAAPGRTPAASDVESAEDGEQIVDLMKANHADLVLMDMQMPKCSGIEATQRILSWYKNDLPSEIALRNSAPRPVLPYVVALTANVLGEHKQQCFDAGMSSFLTKPFSMKVLATALAEAAEKIYAQHRAVRDKMGASRGGSASITPAPGAHSTPMPHDGGLPLAAALTSSFNSNLLSPPDVCSNVKRGPSPAALASEHLLSISRDTAPCTADDEPPVRTFRALPLPATHSPSTSASSASSSVAAPLLTHSTSPALADVSSAVAARLVVLHFGDTRETADATVAAAASGPTSADQIAVTIAE